MFINAASVFVNTFKTHKTVRSFFEIISENLKSDERQHQVVLLKPSRSLLTSALLQLLRATTNLWSTPSFSVPSDAVMTHNTQEQRR